MCLWARYGKMNVCGQATVSGGVEASGFIDKVNVAFLDRLPRDLPDAQEFERKFISIIDNISGYIKTDHEKEARNPPFKNICILN